MCSLGQAKSCVFKVSKWAPQGTLSSVWRQLCLPQLGALLWASDEYSSASFDVQDNLPPPSPQQVIIQPQIAIVPKLSNCVAITLNPTVSESEQLYMFAFVILPIYPRSKAHVCSYQPFWEIFLQVAPGGCRLPSFFHLVENGWLTT